MWPAGGRWVYWLAWLSIGGCIFLYNFGLDNTIKDPFIKTISYLDFTSPKEKIDINNDMKNIVTNIRKNIFYSNEISFNNKNMSKYETSINNTVISNEYALLNKVSRNQIKYVIPNQTQHSLMNAKQSDIVNDSNIDRNKTNNDDNDNGNNNDSKNINDINNNNDNKYNDDDKNDNNYINDNKYKNNAVKLKETKKNNRNYDKYRNNSDNINNNNDFDKRKYYFNTHSNDNSKSNNDIENYKMGITNYDIKDITNNSKINYETEKYSDNSQNLEFEVFKDNTHIKQTKNFKNITKKEKGKKRIITKKILLVKDASNANLNWNVTEKTTARRRTLLTEEEYERIKVIHKTRREHVKKACQSFTINNVVSTSKNMFYSMVTGGDVYRTKKAIYMPQSINSHSFEVDKENHIMYCWLYKVGTTAWNAMFAQLNNQTEILRSKNFYNMRDVLSVKTLQELKEALSYYRFMMVRDPFERFLSAYRDRIEDTSHRSWQRESIGPKILRAYRPHLKTSDMKVNGTLKVIPTFREFSQYLVRSTVHSYDAHWKPFWSHCSPCVLEYNAIGTTNTQDADIKFILEESGLAGKVDPKILQENAHHGRGNTMDLMTKYYKTLDLATIEGLYRRYEVDFKLFDYNVQPLLDALFPGKNVTFTPSL